MAHKYTTWAFAQDIRGSGRKFVLVALADCANGDGYAYPGQTTLGDMTGQSDRSVREHLEWLEEHGYVRRTIRRRKDGTRTSDAYYLPPEDSTGRIFRWTTTGKTFRLSEGQESPDQDEHTPPSPTGKTRRLSASRSTGKSRTGHRKILPVDAEPTSGPSSTAQTPGYQPEESSGHEPLNRQKEPSASAEPHSVTASEEAAAVDRAKEDPTHDLTPSQASAYRLGRGRGQTTSHLSTFHPDAFQALVTFRKLHGEKANDHMFLAWADSVRLDIHAHGERAVIEALEATIENFPSLAFPFKFYRGCLKQARPQPATNGQATPPSDSGGLDQDAIARLINEAKEGTLA